MKERPILFSGEMVRAIMKGWKTQTRRIVKPQPIPKGDDVPILRGDDPERMWWACKTAGLMVDLGDMPCMCPHGYRGDRLWVKEGHYLTKFVPYATSADVVYRADHPGESHPPMGVGRPWRPSIHMHRWASRINLEITAVRVQKLHDISESDAKAEGVIAAAPGHRSAYKDLWNLINGPGSWDKNPWVWILSFKKI